MELFSELFPVPADLYSIKRLVLSEKLRVLKLSVIEQLPFELTFFSSLYLFVKCQRLSRMLSGHVAA